MRNFSAALRSRLKAFGDADRLCAEEYEYPKRLSFPTAVLMLEDEESAFGGDPWAHGLEANEFVLEKFIEYAVAQGYIPKRLEIGEAFWTEDGLGAAPKEKNFSSAGA